MLYAPQLLLSLLCLYACMFWTDLDTLIRDRAIHRLLACKIQHCSPGQFFGYWNFSQYKLAHDPHAVCRFESINSFTWGLYVGVVVGCRIFLKILFHLFHFFLFWSLCQFFFILYSLFILFWYILLVHLINRAHFGENDINNLANEKINAQHFSTRSLFFFFFFCFLCLFFFFVYHIFKILINNIRS